MSEAESKALGMRLAKCIFYFDLDNAGYLPKLTKYVTMAGAQCSAFLDRNVTHLVTDKAATIAENYGRSRKWGFSILPLEEFATIMLGCLDSRTNPAAASRGKTNAGVGVASPTLHRYASVGRKRNLSQYLEDEKRHSGKGKGPLPAHAVGAIGIGASITTATTTAAPAGSAAKRGITPIHAVAANGGGAVGLVAAASEPEKDAKRPYFRPFEHPFVLIDDAALMHAPIWKEFGPDALKTSKSGEPWPVLHWTCPVGYCPFVQPPALPKSPPPHNAKTARGVTTRSRATHEQPSKLPVRAPAAKPALDQPAATSHSAQRPKSKRMTAMNVNRSRPGYCECCYERYSDLAKHVSSLFHRQFALEDKNYSDLDTLLSQISRRPVVVDGQDRGAEARAADRQAVLLRSPVSQKSAVSDCNGSIGRNYMASKRAKQFQALKEFRPCDLRENLDQENTRESNAGGCPTSPSCKRRRSTRTLVVATRLEQ